jgi:hypothetical protein
LTGPRRSITARSPTRPGQATLTARRVDPTAGPGWVADSVVCWAVATTRPAALDRSVHAASAAAASAGWPRPRPARVAELARAPRARAAAAPRHKPTGRRCRAANGPARAPSPEVRTPEGLGGRAGWPSPFHPGCPPRTRAPTTPVPARTRTQSVRTWVSPPLCTHHHLELAWPYRANRQEMDWSNVR